MKVKLKKDRMPRNNGLFRKQMKALNRGETIEIDEIPTDAKPYLVEVCKKINVKKDKGEK